MFGFLSVIRCMHLIEVILGESIFVLKFKRKKHFWLRLLLVIVIELIYALFFPPTSDEGVWRRLLMGILMFFPLWLISLFGLWFCFDEKLELIVLAACSGYLVQKVGSLVDSLFALINPGVLNISITTNLTPYPFLLLAACDISTVIVSYFAFGKPFYKNMGAKINKKIVYPIIITAFLTSLVFGFFYNITMDFINDYFFEALNLYILNFFCCVLVLVIVSGILGKGTVQKELEYTNRIYNLSKENYKHEKESIEIINRKCHDLKHRVMELKTSGNVSFDDILKDIDIYDSSIHTGNEALDIVILNKRLIADKNKIKFNLMLDASALSMMKNTDIFILFGNLIDNAINATKKLEDEDKRIIYIKILNKVNALFISVENMFNGEIILEKGELQTTNSNKEDHGFGVKSIKEIVNKYNGTISIHTEHNIFKTNISFILK